MSRSPSRVDILCGLFQRAEMVTYEQAGESLDLDPVKNRKAIHDAMRGAGKKLLAKDGRALRAVPDVGYRIAAPNEHIELGRERTRRGTKQYRVGLDVFSGTDLTGLSQEAKEAVLAERNRSARVLDFIASTDRRLQKQEAQIEEIKGEVTRNAEDSAEIKKRLAQLEQPG